VAILIFPALRIASHQFVFEERDVYLVLVFFWILMIASMAASHLSGKMETEAPSGKEVYAQVFPLSASGSKDPIRAREHYVFRAFEIEFPQFVRQRESDNERNHHVFYRSSGRHGIDLRMTHRMASGTLLVAATFDQERGVPSAFLLRIERFLDGYPKG
jgi:hypothetical protein